MKKYSIKFVITILKRIIIVNIIIILCLYVIILVQWIALNIKKNIKDH